MADDVKGTTHFSDVVVAGDTALTGALAVTGIATLSRANIKTAVAAAGAVAALIGSAAAEGLKIVVQEETLSPAAIETSLATNVPKGSVILEVLANCQTALTAGGTTVTWSVGVTGDPDKYGTAGHPTQADALTKNSKSSWVCAPLARLAADETIVLTGAATGGAADGNTALSVGTVRVVVIYATFAELANA